MEDALQRGAHLGLGKDAREPAACRCFAKIGGLGWHPVVQEGHSRWLGHCHQHSQGRPRGLEAAVTARLPTCVDRWMGQSGLVKRRSRRRRSVGRERREQCRWLQQASLRRRRMR